MKLVKQVVDVGVGDGGTEGARRATVASPSAAASETEVSTRAERRRFTAEYKRQIVREADRCTKLYSSHLTNWRTARDRGELDALAPKKRGPKITAPDPRDKKLVEQARETARWKKRAERAEALVEVQKKVAALLGTPFEDEKS
jgi:transposase